MIFIFIILFLFLTIFNSYFLVKKLKKSGWSLFAYSLIFLIIFYNILPIISLLFIEHNEVYSYRIPNFHQNPEILFIMFISILLGFSAFYCGYLFTKNKKMQYKSVLITRTIGTLQIKDIIICLIFISSVIGFILYIKGFGSIDNAIANANFVRSGYYTSSGEFGDTSHTFFFRFIFISIIPILYYFTLARQKTAHKVMLIVSIIILFILYFYLSPGRQSIIDFFLIFIFNNLVSRKKIISWQLIIASILAILLLPFLEVFLTSGQSNISDMGFDLKETLVNEFGFPFYTLFYSIDKNYDYFFFSDFITGIFGTILPSSFNPGLESTTYINTFFITGLPGRAFVPAGILGQGYYSLGMIGIIVICGFTGWFSKKVDLYFNLLIKLNPRLSIFYSYFIVRSMVWIRTGLPANYFYSFTFVVLWIFILLSFKIKKQHK